MINLFYTEFRQENNHIPKKKKGGFCSSWLNFKYTYIIMTVREIDGCVKLSKWSIEQYTSFAKSRKNSPIGKEVMGSSWASYKLSMDSAHFHHVMNHSGWPCIMEWNHVSCRLIMIQLKYPQLSMCKPNKLTTKKILSRKGWIHTVSR